MTQELQNQFKSVVSSRCGLYFKDHDLRSLESAIESRIKILKLSSAAAYYSVLVFSLDKENEFRELLNILTVNHTYFFRDEAQFKILKDRILPEIIARKRANFEPGKPLSLRIWSAGCSTGQEPYSIAILARELIYDFVDWNINILATDASENALSFARRGIYHQQSLKQVSANYLEKYFYPQAGAMAVSDEIKRIVSFGFLNLIDGDYPNGFDIIFCRNVVIYFEMPVAMAVMSRFGDSLNKDGTLFVGYSENLSALRHKFSINIIDDAVFYRLAENSAPQIESAPVASISPFPAVAFDIEKLLRELSLEEAKSETKEFDKIDPQAQESFAQAITAMHLKDYSKALELAESALKLGASRKDVLYFQAEVFFNQSDFKKAKEKVQQLLGSDNLFAPAYYLKGCLQIEENAFEFARESFRQALFLDSSLIMAHFYQAQLFKDENKTQDALREYRNTLKFLYSYQPQSIISYSGGYNAATLRSICTSNIERIKLQL